MAKNQLTMQLTKDAADLAKALAKEKGISRNDVLEQAIRDKAVKEGMTVERARVLVAEEA